MCRYALYGPYKEPFKRRKINREPTHPGEILHYEFLEPLKISQASLAKMIGVDVRTVNRTVNGHVSISPSVAIKLARIFDTTPEFWMNAQNAVDLYKARLREEESSFEYQHRQK